MWKTEEAMQLLSCPKNEALLEMVSIPRELSVARRLRNKIHLSTCGKCREQTQILERKWEAFFSPEPEVTSSLLRVYSRLQKDETLILKGWKLNKSQPRRNNPMVWLAQGWLFRGGVVAALLGVITLVLWGRYGNLANLDRGKELNNASAAIPFAQIRMEDKNRIKVHYIQPELLQSIEFETTNEK